MVVYPLNSQETSTDVVCLLDPDEAVTHRLADLLTPLGADVRIFASGQALLEQCDVPPLCVVAEMRLPDMTGVELIGALRRRGVTSPVIFVAAEGDVATAVSAMRAGALDFIEKPHVDRLLAWHVRRLLESSDDSGNGRSD